jgi:transposase
MNAKLYQEIISDHLPPTDFAPDCPEEMKENWYFLQDNDPKHKAKGSMKLLRKKTRHRIYRHPPNTPDLNVMEDVWSYLDRHVRGSRVTTIRGLKKKLRDLWKNLSWDEFRPSVDSMPTRLQQCLKRRGARTDY